MIVFSLLLVFFRNTYLEFWGVTLAVFLLSISALFYIIVGQFFFSKLLKLVPISGFAGGGDLFVFLALPIVIGIVSRLGGEALFYRTMFLEEIGKDYVRTARSKGLSETVVLFRHVLRNALLPILTSTVAVLPLLFLGALIMESFFGIPGLGSYTIDAINAQDFAVVRSMVFVGSVLYIVGLILTDISYTVADPRIRLELGRRRPCRSSSSSPPTSRCTDCSSRSPSTSGTRCARRRCARRGAACCTTAAAMSAAVVLLRLPGDGGARLVAFPAAAAAAPGAAADARARLFDAHAVRARRAARRAARGAREDLLRPARHAPVLEGIDAGRRQVGARLSPAAIRRRASQGPGRRMGERRRRDGRSRDRWGARSRGVLLWLVVAALRARRPRRGVARVACAPSGGGPPKFPGGRCC